MIELASSKGVTRKQNVVVVSKTESSVEYHARQPTCNGYEAPEITISNRQSNSSTVVDDESRKCRHKGNLRYSP